MSAIKGEELFSLDDHAEWIMTAKMEQQKQREECDQRKLEVALSVMDEVKKPAIRRSIDGKVSNWLTVMLLSCYHFDLAAVEFCDALTLR